MQPRRHTTDIEQQATEMITTESTQLYNKLWLRESLLSCVLIQYEDGGPVSSDMHGTDIVL